MPPPLASCIECQLSCCFWLVHRPPLWASPPSSPSDGRWLQRRVGGSLSPSPVLGRGVRELRPRPLPRHHHPVLRGGGGDAGGVLSDGVRLPRSSCLCWALVALAAPCRPSWCFWPPALAVVPVGLVCLASRCFSWWPRCSSSSLCGLRPRRLRGPRCWRSGAWARCACWAYLVRVRLAYLYVPYLLPLWYLLSLGRRRRWRRSQE